LVLSVASQLRRLVSEKGGCPQEDLGGGVTLYCGPNALRFDTPEELSSLVPPLTGIDGFRMTFFSPPSSPEGSSLFVGKPADDASFSVIALADTPARAQELALELCTSLGWDTQQKHQDCVCKEPEKRLKKPLISHVEDFNTAVDAASNVTKVLRAVAKFFLEISQFFHAV